MQMKNTLTRTGDLEGALTMRRGQVSLTATRKRQGTRKRRKRTFHEKHQGEVEVILILALATWLFSIFCYSVYWTVLLARFSLVVAVEHVSLIPLFAGLPFIYVLVTPLLRKMNIQKAKGRMILLSGLVGVLLIVIGLFLFQRGLPPAQVHEDMLDDLFPLENETAELKNTDYEAALYNYCCAKQYGTTPVWYCRNQVRAATRSTRIGDNVCILDKEAYDATLVLLVNDGVCQALNEVIYYGIPVVSEIDKGGCGGGSANIFVKEVEEALFLQVSFVGASAVLGGVLILATVLLLLLHDRWKLQREKRRQAKRKSRKDRERRRDEKEQAKQRARKPNLDTPGTQEQEATARVSVAVLPEVEKQP